MFYFFVIVDKDWVFKNIDVLELLFEMLEKVGEKR